MKTYFSMVGRLFDVRLKGSTTRLASAVLILLGGYDIMNGQYAEGVGNWALGAALWGLRDAIN